MDFNIEYAKEEWIKSFYTLLGEVASEKIYIEMVEAPEFSSVEDFQKKLISKKLPVFYARSGHEVIGWIDISQSSNPRIAHRGFLGMGVRKDFRGKGVGTVLMQKALEQAKAIGLEKVELSVYTTNLSAIKLYKKFDFKEIGVNKHYRKFEGKYFDALEMEKFL